MLGTSDNPGPNVVPSNGETDSWAVRAADRLSSGLKSIVAEGSQAVGAQAALVVGESEVNLVAGFARLETHQMTASTVHSVFCLGKPVLGVAAALAAERSGLAPAEDLGRVLPRALGFSLADILSHRCGCAAPSLAGVRLTPRRDLLIQRAALRLSPDRIYSEVASWFLLEDLIQTLTAMSPSEFLEAELLSPLGVETEILVSLPTVRAAYVSERIGLYYGSLEQSPAPLLADLGSSIERIEPATGMVLSIRGLVRLLDAIAAVRCGSREIQCLPSREYLEGLFSSCRGLVFDEVLHVAIDFAAGFMINTSGSLFDRSVGEDAFGHLGWMGTGFVVSDPRTRVTLGVVLNGVGVDDRKARWVRDGLIRAVWADV